ncbi:O-antigen ligase family protein (plasmid) [Amphritea atlantica]|uniref:O-antigen ligase family protein n=1 Tax=Amphritea atlantica TaxID=355243 RepID=A0ABY5H029_9GAMM|nr:O-antigen ligase family protein [Amphritea atlantica]
MDFKGKVSSGFCFFVSSLERALYILLLLGLSLFLVFYGDAKKLFNVISVLMVVCVLFRPVCFSGKERFFWVLVLLMIPISSFVTYLVHDQERDFDLFLDALRVSGISIILSFFLKGFSKFKVEHVLACVFLCSLLGGVVSLYEWWGSDFNSRISIGTRMLNFFAAAMLASTLVSLYYGFCFFRGRWQWFSLISFCFGSIGVFSTGTRSCIAILIFSLLIAVLYSLVKKKWNVAFFGVVIFLCFSVGVSDVLIKRYHKTLSSVSVYLDESSSVEDKSTSLGFRFEMWKYSLKLIKENPYSGYGSKLFSQLEADSGITRESTVEIGNYNSAHNSLLQYWVSKGVLGVLAYFLMILYPLLLALFKRFKGREAVIIISLTYLLTGLTENNLGHAYSLAFYFLFLTALLTSYYSKCEEKGLEDDLDYQSI